MPERSTTPAAGQAALEQALIQACEFAKAHDADEGIIPADFGIQHSTTGQTTATYIDGDHAVIMTLDSDGTTTLGIAELVWIHDNADGDRLPCDYCEYNPDDFPNASEGDDYFGPPMHDVYLPGDAPAVGPQHAEVVAVDGGAVRNKPEADR